MKSSRRISRSSSRWTSRRAARRWTTSNGCISNAYCARRSTTSHARRGSWTSIAPRFITSCGATVCGETDSPDPASQRGRAAGAGTRGAGTSGGHAGAHVPHTVPHPAGDVRRFVRAGRRAAAVLFHGDPPAPGARLGPGCAHSGRDGGRSLYPGAHLRVWGSAVGWKLRGGLHRTAARGVLRHAAARRTVSRAPGEGGGSRAGTHLRAAPLRGLAVRDVVQPRGGTARRERGGFLRHLQEMGAARRILVGDADKSSNRSLTVAARIVVAPIGAATVRERSSYATAHSGPIAGDRTR